MIEPWSWVTHEPRSCPSILAAADAQKVSICNQTDPRLETRMLEKFTDSEFVRKHLTFVFLKNQPVKLIIKQNSFKKAFRV